MEKNKQEELKELNIVLLDINHYITDSWKSEFKGLSNIQVLNMTLQEYLKNNKVECIVSPANSFGLMDGGFDKYIIDYFGLNLMKMVQSYILNEFYGEQPICTSFIINTYNAKVPYLIHTPTMGVPMDISRTLNVYYCMKSTLKCAIDNNIKSILIPAFGGCCGNVQPKVIAKQMKLAYKHMLDVENKITWNYANDRIYEISNTLY